MTKKKPPPETSETSGKVLIISDYSISSEFVNGRRFPPPPHFPAPGGRQRAALTHPYFPAFSNHADPRRAGWGIPPEARFVQHPRRLKGYITADYRKVSVGRTGNGE